MLFDGTFWTDDELIRLGIGERTAREMDHLPVSGPDGSLARLAALPEPAAGLHAHQQHQPHADRGRRPSGALVEQPPVSGSASTACGSPSRSDHDHHARRLAARHAAPAADSRARAAARARRSWRRRCASFHGSYYVQHPFHQLMYEGKL